jgi:hypothetical protein
MTPKQELATFIDRFTPAVAKLAKGSLAKLRKLTPGSLELVYDNYNALAVGFSPTERPSDGIFSIAIFPRYPTLFFLQGVKLPDPSKRLRGSGSVVRHIVIDGLATFEEPAVRKLIAVALAKAKVPLDPKQPRRVIIKSIAAKQRPRRPTGG